MPFPLLPIVVGVICFVAGLGASRVRFVRTTGVEKETDSREYLGEPVGVHMEDGRVLEGNLQDLTEDALILEVGEQTFTTCPLKRVKKVEVYAN